MPTGKKKRRKQQTLQNAPDILTVPTLNASTILKDTFPIHDRVDVLPSVEQMKLNDDSADCELMPQISTKIMQLPHMNQMVNMAHFCCALLC